MMLVDHTAVTVLRKGEVEDVAAPRLKGPRVSETSDVGAKYVPCGADFGKHMPSEAIVPLASSHNASHDNECLSRAPSSHVEPGQSHSYTRPSHLAKEQGVSREPQSPPW
jgi:hypothetical protein